MCLPLGAAQRPSTFTSCSGMGLARNLERNPDQSAEDQHHKYDCRVIQKNSSGRFGAVIRSSDRPLQSKHFGSRTVGLAASRPLRVSRPVIQRRVWRRYDTSNRNRGALADILGERNSHLCIERKAKCEDSPMIIVYCRAIGGSAIAVSGRRLLRARLDFNGQVSDSGTASTAGRWRPIASLPNQRFLDANRNSAFIGGFLDGAHRGRKVQMSEVDRRAKKRRFRKRTVRRRVNAPLCDHGFP